MVNVPRTVAVDIEAKFDICKILENREQFTDCSSDDSDTVLPWQGKPVEARSSSHSLIRAAALTIVSNKLASLLRDI